MNQQKKHTDQHLLTPMHLMSIKFFDVVKRLWEVWMRSSMKTSLHIPEGQLQWTKPVQNINQAVTQ